MAYASAARTRSTTKPSPDAKPARFPVWGVMNPIVIVPALAASDAAALAAADAGAAEVLAAGLHASTSAATLTPTAPSPRPFRSVRRLREWPQG